jgi:hypothetical protein
MLLCRLPEGQTPKALQRELSAAAVRVSSDGLLRFLVHTKAASGGGRISGGSDANGGAGAGAGDADNHLEALVETETAARVLQVLEALEDASPTHHRLDEGKEGRHVG